MKLIIFRLSGRLGHFLRAEGGASAPTSYPVPPRTAILGILGAVLGLEKDQPQELLEPAHLALQGKLPQTHWHGAKFRQEAIERLPRQITIQQKGNRLIALAPQM
jgi:CRISPR-associated protein Cas5h